MRFNSVYLNHTMPNRLRQRKTGQAAKDVFEMDESAKHAPRADDIVWGKTPAGEGMYYSSSEWMAADFDGLVFQVPTTHDVLTALFHPAYHKSHFDLLNLSLLGLQLVLFFCLPRRVSKIFFLVYFAFWRGSYDAGLGFVLSKQSRKKWIVREVHRRGWLDGKRRPRVRNWIRAQLVGKMGKDYSFDVRPGFLFSFAGSASDRNDAMIFQELPLEYNTWLLFRQMVDIILLKFVVSLGPRVFGVDVFANSDFVAYCMFAFSWFRVPEGLSMFVHIMR
jgi:phosphatidylethanolamine N-methyltransferase